MSQVKRNAQNLSNRAPWPGDLLRLTAALLTAVLLWLPAQPAGAAITLAEMSATAQANGSILVRWVTATEQNSSQFVLYRSENPDGPWDDEVNRQDAKDLSGLVGATYVYTDDDVTPNTTYYYVLGELETGGNLNKYTDARVSATAGQVSVATATATQNPTPTRTATPTGNGSASPTGTATPSRTPTRTPQPTQTPADRATATRRFTNTPRPTVLPTLGPASGGTASPTLPSAGAATPLSGATVSTPASTPQQGVPLAMPTPAASPLAPGAPMLTVTLTPAAAAPTDALSQQPMAGATATPQTFGTTATDQPLLGAGGRPQAQPTPAPAGQAARNSRLILLLGGIAVGLAALLGGVAFAIWLRRQR